VATKFTEVVGASTAFAGATEIEVSVAELTVSGALPETPSKVAEMLTVPGAIAVALPRPPTVATAGLSEAHVESLVITCLVRSLNKPLAAKPNLVPGAMVRPEGVTVTDTMLAFETSSVVEPLIEPSFAVMVVVPGVRAFARPPRAMVATAGLDEVQDTCPVTLRVLPSVKLPIARNCWLVRGAIFLFAGRTVMKDRTAGWTFTVVVPVTESKVAEIVAEPRATAVASPVPAIDATVVSDEDQVTESVMFCVL